MRLLSKTGLGLSLVLILIAPHLSATQLCQVSLSSQIQEEHLSRETSLMLSLPSGWTIRLANDSFDTFFYGTDIRWGLTGGYAMQLSGIQLTTAGGLSLTSSQNLTQQLSLDVYLKAQY